jgi:hypothetical protein
MFVSLAIPLFHKYPEPPVATNVADSWLHIVRSAPAFAVGVGLTVTTTLSDAEHPFAPVPVTTYVIVASGLAKGFGMVVEFNAIFGDQTYVSAPLAFNVTDDPAHMATFAPALTIGAALTVTVTSSVPEQPLPFDTVTTYVVVNIGLASGLAMFGLFNPVAGLQLYIAPPVALSVVDVPWQIATFIPALGVTPAFTVTTTSSEEVQPLASVVTTVYVVVFEGIAIGFEIVDELNVPAGIQLKLTPPEAFRKAC